MIWRWLHHYLILKDQYLQLSVLNYGYAGIGSKAPALNLKQEDEPNRYGIQMYLYLVSSVDLDIQDISAPETFLYECYLSVAYCLNPPVDNF